jgi:hypothetical protein
MQTVIILNPMLGCRRTVKLATATKWVSSGRAHWTDAGHTRLLLSPQLRRHLSAGRQEKAQNAANYDAILRRGTPLRPPLRSHEMRHIPIVGNATRLLYLTPPRKPPGRATE